MYSGTDRYQPGKKISGDEGLYGADEAYVISSQRDLHSIRLFPHTFPRTSILYLSYCAQAPSLKLVDRMEQIGVCGGRIVIVDVGMMVAGKSRYGHNSISLLRQVDTWVKPGECVEISKRIVSTRIRQQTHWNTPEYCRCTTPRLLVWSSP